MEAPARAHARDELVLVEMTWERQLEQDAVHALVGVKGADQRGERIRRDVAARLVMEGLDPHLGRVFTLHADVDGGGGIVADEDRGETGLPVHRLDLAPHPLAYACGHGLPVDDLGAHRLFNGA